MSSDHAFISEQIILFCVLLIVAIIIGQILEKYEIAWLPASGAQMIFGFIVGAIVYYSSKREVDFLMFNPNFFFFLLLPLIIFESGYAMRRTNFFRNIGSILLFAFVGTVISTFVIGLGIYWLAKLDMLNIAKDPLDPLAFGALISSIDPIATLVILGNKNLRCDPLLYTLVFGESVLNDAVAITLYQTFIGFRNSDGPFAYSQIGIALGKFCLICLGSIAIGAAIALLCSFTLRRINFSKKPSSELIIIFFSAYTCYCVAELTHMSGIMSLFICGVMQAHYAWYNVSAISRTTTRHTFHAFAHISEAFLYVYFGISAFFSTHSNLGFEWDWRIIIWSLILIFVARALNIFPLAYIANLGRKHKISWRMQVVMWYTGLRGVISFAMAFTLNSPNKGANQFITATMVIIAFTTLLLGGTSQFFLAYMGMLGVSDDTTADDSHGTQISDIAPSQVHVPASNADVYTQLGGESEDDTTSRRVHFADDTADGEENVFPQETLVRVESKYAEYGRASCCRHLNLHRLWTRFDISIMQPLFGGRHAPRIIDYSADPESVAHGADNSQMLNPYLLPAVQQTEHQVEVDDEIALTDIEDDGDEPEVFTTSVNAGSPLTHSLSRRGSFGASIYSTNYHSTQHHQPSPVYRSSIEIPRSGSFKKQTNFHLDSEDPFLSEADNESSSAAATDTPLFEQDVGSFPRSDSAGR